MTAIFHIGDAIEVMGKLPEDSVDLVLTSPPFLALRSYLPADHPDKALEGGSQSTPGEYIDWLIDVVEACDRVLTPHGSLCVELGDTYSGSGGAGGDYAENGLREGQPKFGGSGGAQLKISAGVNGESPQDRSSPQLPPAGKLANYNDARGNPDGMRDTTFSGGNTRTGGGTGWPLAKSLSLIPELFRLTLVYGTNPLTGRQTERWRLRNVIRWVRPNPPVGALGDKFRPATSELMVFCKSAKRYFDLDSVREPYSDLTMKVHGKTLNGAVGGLNGPKSTLTRGLTNQKLTHSGAPPLDWWNIPPGGYEGAHYAVFPPELCVKPVKAMCPERVCRVCGEPSRRIVGEATYERDGELVGALDAWPWGGNEKGRRGERKSNDGGITRQAPTLGFSDCGHDDWRAGLILDPFGGSGTTALVATGHGRDCILIDLDERNYDLALQRVGPLILSLAEVV